MMCNHLIIYVVWKYVDVNNKETNKDRSIIAIANIADNAEHNSSSVKEKASTLPGLHHLCQDWLDQYMKVSAM